MTKKVKIPPGVTNGAWLLSFIVFVVGFWHTHLGLKQMNVFGSEYGSLAVALIVLLLLLITYWYAVNGKKEALYFYIMCGFVFFVSNLNYFYPAYQGRNLVIEEAGMLDSVLQTYKNQAIALKKPNDKTSRDLNDLRTLASSVYDEISKINGKGPKAREDIRKFNYIARKYTNVDADVGIGLIKNQKANDAAAKKLLSAMENIIKGIEKSGSGLAASKFDLVNGGITHLETLSKEISPKLGLIQQDQRDIDLDKVKSNPQIQIMKKAVKGIDSAVVQINSGMGTPVFKLLNSKDNPVPKTQFLGQVKHTFETISERISDISTWWVISLCLFVDLIVPMAIYYLLKKNDMEIGVKRNMKPGTF